MRSRCGRGLSSVGAVLNRVLEINPCSTAVNEGARTVLSAPKHPGYAPLLLAQSAIGWQGEGRKQKSTRANVTSETWHCMWHQT